MKNVKKDTKIKNPSKFRVFLYRLARNSVLGFIPGIWFGGIFVQLADKNLLVNSSFTGPAGHIDFAPLVCLKYFFSDKTGLIGLAVFLFLINSVYFYYKGKYTPVNNNKLDEERNIEFSDKGTYGTSSWMSEEEKEETINSYSSLDGVSEIILGKDENDLILTIPESTRMNKHIAVYGASGTGKSRAFARNYMLQAIRRNESCIITDPKGELFETMAPKFRQEGYDVKVLNLVNLDHSDSWNCLKEVNGNDLKAQIFANSIIENASNDKKGDFWSLCEMSLLKALCLYVCNNPAIPTTMEQVYSLITSITFDERDRLFDELPNSEKNEAAKAAYNSFKTSSDNVKGSAIIGLGSKLQVFQSHIVKQITNYEEINLVKPGKEKCAYFCITSDQHSSFDFLAVLFYTMLFINLVEYADSQPGGRCKVPVNFVLDEFPNIGAIPDFTKKISTVRSRALNICVIFQNIAQLQNRYPLGKWEEILGNCDTHLFLGCTDQTTAKFISERTGIATIGTSSTSHDASMVKPGRNSEYIKESSSVGKRNLLTPDEVLRLPSNEMLLLFRGHNPLKAYKFDYSQHPEANSLKSETVSDYVPEWTTLPENSANRNEVFEAENIEEKEEPVISTPPLANAATSRNKKPNGFK